MILYAAEGQSNAEIARRLETAAEVVSRWRKRFFEDRLAGLEDRARAGRPRRFPPGAVYWIVDNGSSHAGKTSSERMEEKWKNARLVHPPIHASWLNQIELVFSIVQRKALTPNDFHSLEALAERLLAFGDHYRQIARPFDWTFTRADLEQLLTRIDNHEPRLRLAA